MSTRANFLIITPENKIQQYYNHSDGYPSGLGNNLRRYIVFAIGLKSISENNESIYSLFIQEISHNTKPKQENISFCSYEKELLMELEDHTQIHADIEYIYIIDFTKPNVELYVDNAWMLYEKVKTNKDIINRVCKPENIIKLNKFIDR